MNGNEIGSRTLVFLLKPVRQYDNKSRDKVDRSTYTERNIPRRLSSVNTQSGVTDRDKGHSNRGEKERVYCVCGLGSGRNSIIGYGDDTNSNVLRRV